MKRLLLITLVLLFIISGIAHAQTGGNSNCDPDAVQQWILQRQAMRQSSQDTLDAQGVSINQAMLQLSKDLQAIEDLERPSCADGAMLWTYYLYTNLNHLLICAQVGDSACTSEMQGRLNEYRTRDEQIMASLAAGSGISLEALKPPTPTPAPQTQTLGPIWDSLYDENYSVEVLVGNPRTMTKSGFQEAKTGHVFLIVDVTVRNLGPGTLRNMSSFSFQIRDGNGAIRNTDFVSAASDCGLDLLDLTAGGSVSGCVSFEVPATGSLELIYAPYQYDGLEPGRYLGFRLR